MTDYTVVIRDKCMFRLRDSDRWRQCVNSFDFIATIFSRWLQSVVCPADVLQASTLTTISAHTNPEGQKSHQTFIGATLSLHAASSRSVYRKALMWSAESPVSPTSALDDSQHPFLVSTWISWYAYSSDWISVAEVSQSKGISSILGSLGNSVASEIKVEDLSVKDAIVA